MSEKGQKRERLREASLVVCNTSIYNSIYSVINLLPKSVPCTTLNNIYYKAHRFQTERLASLGKKIAARKASPGLFGTKSNSNLVTAEPSEKGWYYLSGFLDAIKFIRAIARNNPERLPALLRLKGGSR